MKKGFVLVLLPTLLLFSCTTNTSTTTNQDTTPSLTTTSTENTTIEETTVENTTEESVAEETTVEETTVDETTVEESTEEEETLSIEDIEALLPSLDETPNYTMEFSSTVIYNEYNKEEEHEYIFVNNAEVKSYVTEDYASYKKVDEYQNVYSYYQLTPGKYTKSTSYWVHTYFDTGHFLSKFKNSVITTSLSDILKDNKENIVFNEDNDNPYFEIEEVTFPLDLEYCKVYAQRSDNLSFSYFAKDSYPDWKATNFKIEPKLEDNEITSIKISYDAKEMYPEFGNSGKVDFNFTDYDLHVEFIITNIGSTEVEIPLDLPW